MKKPAKSAPSAKKSNQAKNEKNPVDPVMEAVRLLGPDTLELLSQLMENGRGGGLGGFGLADPVEVFEDYLEHCRNNSLEKAEGEGLFSELISELAELRIGANGGDPEARESVEAIHDLLKDALENQHLDVPAMMMTGKILTDAAWETPEFLKAAVEKALRTPPPGEAGAFTGNVDLRTSLLEMALEAGPDPFDIYDFMNSMTSALPTEARIPLINELIAGDNAAIGEAMEGFALHQDEALARGVLAGLAASAKNRPAESILAERLVLMRPWLPPSRQTSVDETIRALRLNALPPTATEPFKLIKCYASIADGAGASNLVATQRTGSRYQVLAAMVKPDGVADIVILPDLPKSQMDATVRQMKSAAPSAETDPAGFARLLRLAIGENLTSGNPPPFRTVQFVEALGMGPVHPDAASPAELIERLLADLPAEQKAAAAVAKAHADVLISEFGDTWFEAGEEVENLLAPIRGAKKRAAKLMRDLLPRRRQFWARQCALAALVLRDDRKQLNPIWKQLALVGGEIVSDTPLDAIPLMKLIAEHSAKAFIGQGW